MLASIIYEETLSGGVGRRDRRDLPVQVPAWKTQSDLRADAALRGPAKKVAGRDDEIKPTVPIGTQVSGPGLLNTEATQAATPAAPASLGATRTQGHQALRAAASLAKAARQRDDEESMIIMLLAASSQNESALQALWAPQGDRYV